MIAKLARIKHMLATILALLDFEDAFGQVVFIGLERPGIFNWDIFIQNDFLE